MQRLKIKKHSFLFAALLFFCLTIFSWYFFASNAPDDKTSNSVNNKLNDELKVLVGEGQKIKKIIHETETPSFPRLITSLNYPYFIFRNKGLYFWSENHFSPSHESLTGKYEYRFLQLRNGKYIVHRETAFVRGDLFEIFSFLPLSTEYSVENNYISSKLNKHIFNSLPYNINVFPTKSGDNMYSESGEFLFSIEIPEKQNSQNESLMILLVVFTSLGIIFAILYLLKWVFYLINNHRIESALILLILSLVLIRGVMLIFDFPFSLYDCDLFNSKYFASSVYSPSLGDVLINTLLLVVISFVVFKVYYKTAFFKWLIKQGNGLRTVFSILLSILSFCALYFVFYTIGMLSFHSQWSLDITSDIDFNEFRIVSIIIYFAAFVIYFVFSHIIFKIFYSLNNKSFNTAIIRFISGGVLFSAVSWIYLDTLWLIVVLNIIYFLIIYFLELPQTIGRLKYATYIYYLLCALICSITGSYSLYVQGISKMVYDKNHFARDLENKNDVFGEFLLDEASRKIKDDEFTKQKFITPLSSKGIIEYKIKKVFLNNYFDKYDVLVSVFDQFGMVYEKSSDYVEYYEAVRRFRSEKFQTEYPEIYFIKDSETGSKRYINFNEIKIDNIIVGYIILELKPKKVIPHSVYPELLVNNYSDKNIQASDYNYAIFSSGNLLYNYGNYNYFSDFNLNDLNNGDLYKDGLTRGAFHHLGIKEADGRIVIVTSEQYNIKRIFSNFSFFLLTLILLILFFITIYALNSRSNYLNKTYATRIQIYLNIAFFLPLLIVSVITLSVISATYKDNLNNSFIKKAEEISVSVRGYMREKKLNESQKEKLENVLDQVGRYNESDINLFNNKGRLIFTNRPMIYEFGFFSKLINPLAYSEILDNPSSSLMVSEKLGKLRYKSVYVPIKSLDNNELLGILSMPFFESKNELDRQIIQVLTTIVNIFVSIFILFLVLSYFASHLLTVPLKIITQKLKRTTLEKNEPIEWKKEDEIGLLINEYNSMLIKLEDSKDALTKSEKESAWREMAKQVAHEIKNPLTPMKLTIQHLQRSVQAKDDTLPEKTQKALHVLLEQINNLNEIATSFSLFAKMPIPKTYRFEVASVVSTTTSLHNNNSEVNVETKIEPGHFFVLGDEQMMSGIITNLILNGIQSVPVSRDPSIEVCLTKRVSTVLITVKDNGSGIPDNIRDKVFLPNFSTKFAGSGIGLAVAKRGVEHAGGKIWFETIEDKGTSFHIEIPLAD